MQENICNVAFCLDKSFEFSYNEFKFKGEFYAVLLIHMQLDKGVCKR